MPGGIGEHRLEALAGRALLVTAPLRLAARGPQPIDQLVAGLLELGDSDQPAGLGGGEDMVTVGAGGLRVGREAPFEARDLVAQGAAGSRLVATLERRDLVGLHGRNLEQIDIRSHSVAARIENAGQVARIDAGVACSLSRRRGEILDRR